MPSMLGKIFSSDILKYFSYFSQKIGFDIACKLSPCMNYQSLFSGKNKKNIVNLSSAEFAHSGLSVKHIHHATIVALYKHNLLA